MTTRSEREKAQKLNDQHQVILNQMLREDDNKYCADCEAKGPRWASWNLGVFMCIRCAGIHRNLGVHISRVKSVNLDQWTPEQIQSMVDMGNSRARQLYEAHLPENFRRPQTDQAVEFFIRDKYERKKYYDKDALNGAPRISPPQKEREKKKEEKKREKDSEKGNRPSASEKKREELQAEPRASPKKSAEPTVDLLGLDGPAGGSASTGSGSSNAAPMGDELDIFGPMVSNPLPSSNHTQAASSKAPADSSSSGGPTLATSTSTSTPSSSKPEEGAKKPLSKDSILSLYSSTPASAAPQTTGASATAPGQGMYMGQPQMQFPAQPTAGYQSYPGMGGAMPPTTMMGGPLPQMGQNVGMVVGMAMPNGYVGMVPPGAGAGQGQGMYPMGGQPQQGQWAMNQMTQQMSGMAMGGQGPAAFGQPATPLEGWGAAPPSGQTLSTQLWK
ncbi:stromal membrane-associated protein 1 [Aplochiton taeniatus]